MTAFVGFGLRPPSTHGPRATVPYLMGTVSSELYLVMLLFLVAPTTLALVEGDLRWTRHDVVRIKNLRYGDAPGRANLLDLYRSRTGPAGGPVLVYFEVLTLAASS